MRKKEIEKIPYLKLPETSTKKKVKYIGVTALKNVGHVRTIILEVYRNKKGCKDIPVVRYVANKKDWGVFFPDKGKWTHQKISTYDYYEGFVWQQAGECAYTERDKVNVLYSEIDLHRIKNYFKPTKIWGYEKWWDFFGNNETNICNAKTYRKYELRQEKLKDREKNTPQLDEKEILDWSKKAVFKEKHFLYYKKKGRRATICCSKCGGVSEGIWKTGDSYESQFEKTIKEPVDKLYGICPLCGSYGIYKPQGKAKNKFYEKEYVFTADKFKDNGAVIRYIELQHDWILDEVIGDKGAPEMYAAKEEYSGIEIARCYFEPGKEPQTDYHKNNCHTGDYWDDCNLYGMSNIPIYEGFIYPKMTENLKGTILQYSSIELYQKQGPEKINAIKYMERYREWPQIEMLVKMGLTGLVKEMTYGYCGIICNSEAKRIDEFLGINKNHVKDLIEEHGDADFVKALKWEKQIGMHWSAEQVKYLSMVNTDKEKLKNALNYMSIEQLINRIEKYAGTKFAEDIGHTSSLERLKHITTMYMDYLEMRIEMGYDLNNSVFAYPRDLENAHQKMILEQSEKVLEDRFKEVRVKFPQIREHYRTLRNKYLYEDENLIIRPARSAEEIVLEGRTLHHCVGGDDYLNKHNTGTSYILLLREKGKEEIPYVTVEIRTETNKIVQWYGAHDKKPDEQHIAQWLNRFKEFLKSGIKEQPSENLAAAV